MFTTPMIRLLAIVLQQDAEKVAADLLQAGVIHFVNIPEESAASLTPLTTAGVGSAVPLADISDLRRKIEGLLFPENIYPATPTDDDLRNPHTIVLRDEKKRIQEVAQQKDSIREQQRFIQQEILRLEDLKRQVTLYGVDKPGAFHTIGHSFVTAFFGKLPDAQIVEVQHRLEGTPSVLLPISRDPKLVYAIIIGMKRDSQKIQETLNGVGWIPIEVPQELNQIKGDVEKNLNLKIEELYQKQDRLRDAVHELVVTKSEGLVQAWKVLRVNELVSTVKSYFSQSSRTVIFSGWFPAQMKERIIARIREITRNRCYLELNPAEEFNTGTVVVPVQLNSSKILAPFQMLVRNFGIPEYGTVDPTMIVMPLYLGMFGIMFADVGHGLVLLLSGLIGTRYFSRKKKDGYVTLSHLLLWCGVSSMVFGVAFGSYFGLQWLPPLWFDFHGTVSGHVTGGPLIYSIFDVLGLAIYFGIAVISCGMLFNWINLIKKRRWYELIFEKAGLLGGWMYGGGVFTGIYTVSHSYKELPPSNLLVLLLGLPAFMLLFKEPVMLYMHWKENHTIRLSPSSIFLMIFEWLIELLEIVSGYLSNTLSFMRVAGLGIAHVSLLIAFYSLAEMVHGTSGLIIIVFGNLLVIGLEGLSAGIQSLRLNYYEFFTKFFHGTGKLYTPLSLKTTNQ